MKSYRYHTRGTCSSEIRFDIDDDKTIHNVVFTGGCNGNLQAVGRLVEGMPAAEVLERCGGIRCGFKNTSCPDQLAKAINEAIDLEEKENRE